MRISFALVCFLFITNCSRNSVENENCQFLLNIGVNESVNLSFYPQLQFVSETAYIPNIGNGGVVLINTTSGLAAFDAADPNHPFDTCSVLTIEGVIGKCNCEDKNEFSLLTGLPIENANSSETAPRCALRRYRVEQNGNTLLIFN
ncbi:hypothetical protein H7U19_07355 [Hyunsoonleella sp. SJ7]|uniref:Ferredoxin subunit of nitrite reductase or a ring-hydroxylating dioxygenase n=1 Tax=Hyunsoonleella aquatilis TaxID=2762758 RepID=A0A923KIA9_9FLAO|nr:hypothetical protein [Hyunsoonleella aquatilis]MBC3758214.1 hypothetical protein [Hyunsoonleella aquatilis]